jgi:uncharacterized membrane protein YfcA
MHLEPWQWVLIICASFGIGLSKTGIVGLGVLMVAIFALVFPGRQSVGLVLPILISADIIAVTAFRRHAVWAHLWRLFPWAALGIVLGWWSMDRINDVQAARLIGAILIALVFIQGWRQYRTSQMPEEAEELSHPKKVWFMAAVGVMAGFTTMVANAAGPLMTIYLLSARLPKREFIGTGAWYFLILNLFKVPFSYRLGIINPSSLGIDFALAPFAMLGALHGKWLLQRIPQSLFEKLALIFTLIAGFKLLLV